jgi:hypothetical protein
MQWRYHTRGDVSQSKKPLGRRFFGGRGSSSPVHVEPETDFMKAATRRSGLRADRA